LSWKSCLLSPKCLHYKAANELLRSAAAFVVLEMAGYGDYGGYEDERLRFADEYDDEEEESEECRQVILQPDEFNGLIGSVVSNIMKGGGGGNLIGDIAGQILGGGGGGSRFGRGDSDYRDESHGDEERRHGKGGFDAIAGGLKKGDIGGVIGNILGGGKGKDIGNFIGGIFGGKKKHKQRTDEDYGDYGGDSGRGGDDYGGGGRSSGGGGGVDPLAGLISNVIGGKGGKAVGDIIGRVLGGRGGPGHRGEGANIPQDQLTGGLIDTVSRFIGLGAHKFFGIDPDTGRILGSIAGNLIFGLGGKDNVLGQIGKIILDNIISGKFKRKVEPFIPPEPSPIPRPPAPGPGPPSDLAQDFYKLRDQCLREEVLFEDPNFPADSSSLFYTRQPSRYIEWRRPGKIVDEPQLFVEGHSRFDVIQGELGDCWLLAAAASLTLKDELFYRVVPPDQSFTENYAGIFHFQFWRYGKWVDVVVDDRLPVINGKLAYMHSESNSEFWSALLEKAYAKLHGSYEALKGGTTSEALEDFTGGLTELIDLTEAPKNAMAMVFRAFELGSLMGCSIDADPNVWEARMPNGLVKGHAYSITGAKQVETLDGERVPLLRIRNPWGSEQEWNGPWSDGSREWRNVSDSAKEEIELQFKHDGEFWMSFSDFMRNFEKLEICNLGPEVMDEIAEMTGRRVRMDHWNTSVHDGVWMRGRSAGGCKNFARTFAMNPQYAITLTDADPNDEDDLCTCIFGVLQKYRRELRHKGVDVLPIGFAVFPVDGIQGPLSCNQLANAKSCARSPVFINLREICGRFRLPPGDYVLIPSTYQPNEEGEFMVRVFTNGLLETEALQ
ncbi:hypothetical protein M513_10306, partial [Trichuris suis]